jgi:hypothetical protein
MPCVHALSTASLTSVADRFITFRLLPLVHSEVERIVHWMPEVLFATEIAFRGLNRCVLE